MENRFVESGLRCSSLLNSDEAIRSQRSGIGELDLGDGLRLRHTDSSALVMNACSIIRGHLVMGGGLSVHLAERACRCEQGCPEVN